jgi:hypothetical protein
MKESESQSESEFLCTDSTALTEADLPQDVYDLCALLARTEHRHSGYLRDGVNIRLFRCVHTF